ncbi:hypothetical protein SAMN05444166_1193 [Singulisphaera sp. GP187]|nr:hypothetical protein SAMN05444166_1193 [Singulisphaera sp. GP187]
MGSMGKKPRSDKNGIGRPRSDHPRQTVIAIRGNPAWRAWIHRLAGHMRLKSTDLIDRALVELAQRNDFPEPAPKR